MPRESNTNFFLSELRKIMEVQYPDATYVGRTCYVRLNELKRAKIKFATCGIADQYEALQLTILNRNDGQVDRTALWFKDVLGRKQVNNPNFRNGLEPYVWTYQGQTEWYGYKPNSQDYKKLADAVHSYLEVFQEPVQAKKQQWQQTM